MFADLGGLTQATPEQLAARTARYDLQIDPDSIGGLVERFDLRFPGGADLSALTVAAAARTLGTIVVTGSAQG